MDPIIELIFANAGIIISWVITAVVGAIAFGQYKILKDILGLSQDLAVFWVLKGRVTADGKITTVEGEEVINKGFAFLTKLELIIGTYILNRPETGWLRGYGPTIIEELAEAAKPDDSSQNYSITSDSNAQPSEQPIPVTPVPIPTGGTTV